MEKTCLKCGTERPITDFWNLKRSPDGKDNICIICKNQEREQYENSEQGLYELKARLLSSVFRLRWFPHITADQHLDHKFSISKGWQRSVPLNILCNQNNLEPLTPKANRRKGSRCSISISELFDTYQPDEHLTKLVQILEHKDRAEIKALTAYVISKNSSESIKKM